MQAALTDVLQRYNARRAKGEIQGPELRAVRLYKMGWRLEPFAANLDRPATRQLVAETDASTEAAMTRLLNSIRDRWIRFWFAPAAATNLGVSRVLFFGALAAFYIPHNFSIWGSVSPAFLQPIWLFETFRVPVLSPAMLRRGGNGVEAVAGFFVPGPFQPAEHGG